jgi:hypothetical protein
MLDTEQRAGRRDALGAVGAGEEPVVADAMEALGQHVQQEAPDELVRMKPHRLPAEGDAGVIGCNEAVVRDGDTVV